MKKVIAWLLVLALTAAVSIGATLAYLTDIDEDVNVMTLGKVKIDQLEYERIDTETENEEAKVQEFHDNKPLLPAVVADKFGWTTGDSYVNWDQIGSEGSDLIWDPANINNEVDKMVFVKNKGDYDAYVRSVMAFEAGNYTTLEQFLSKVHLNINTEDYDWEWVEAPQTIGEGKYFIATATYKNKLAPGKLTPPSLLQIALDPSATNEDVEAFGDTYQVLVKSQGVQADGFDSADHALNEGFRTTSESNIPWETDSPTLGIDLHTALHYLQGNQEKQITRNVTNVYFAKNSEYPQIVNNEKGILVDMEQNVPVHAYYVESGSGNYDIYLLASDKVVIPKYSNGLFRDMRALVSVDTHNADFSNAEDMTYMFRDCRVLTGLDTSAWNIQKATNMKGMFQNCYVLPKLEVGAWNTENVTDLSYMFSSCRKLQTINGTENWKTGNVTNLMQTFVFCYELQSLNLKGWDTSNVTNMMGTFGECHVMTSLDVTGWNTGKVTTTQNMFFKDYKLPEIMGIESFRLSNNQNAGYMFQQCESLKSLNVSNWNMGQVTNFEGVFYKCHTLATITGLQNWNTGSGTTMAYMFLDCHELNGIDLSTWDVSNVKTVQQMFLKCYALETLDLGNWNTKNLTTARSMFSGTDYVGNMKLRELNVSNWDTSSLTDISFMFYGCNQLKELDLSGWDTSKVTQMSTVFNWCHGIETIYVSERWTVENVVRHDDLFSNCENLAGGNGTVFDSAHTGKEYACIDTPETPGYLTYKAPPAANNTAP